MHSWNLRSSTCVRKYYLPQVLKTSCWLIWDIKITVSIMLSLLYSEGFGCSMEDPEITWVTKFLPTRDLQHMKLRYWPPQQPYKTKKQLYKTKQLLYPPPAPSPPLQHTFPSPQLFPHEASKHMHSFHNKLPTSTGSISPNIGLRSCGGWVYIFGGLAKVSSIFWLH